MRDDGKGFAVSPLIPKPTDKNHPVTFGISDEKYIELLTGQSQGKRIVSNKEGYPVLIEPPPSAAHELNRATLTWEISPEKQAALLQQQREQICEQINALKVEKTKGGVLLNGHWFDTDGEAQINVMGAYNGMLLAGLKSRQWTTYDNQIVTITLDEMKALYLAVLNVKDHNHKTSIMHKRAVIESDDPIHYDYSTGWSETYDDYQHHNNVGAAVG